MTAEVPEPKTAVGGARPAVPAHRQPRTSLRSRSPSERRLPTHRCRSVPRLPKRAVRGRSGPCATSPPSLANTPTAPQAQGQLSARHRRGWHRRRPATAATISCRYPRSAAKPTPRAVLSGPALSRYPSVLGDRQARVIRRADLGGQGRLLPRHDRAVRQPRGGDPTLRQPEGRWRRLCRARQLAAQTNSSLSFVA